MKFGVTNKLINYIRREASKQHLSETNFVHRAGLNPSTWSRLKGGMPITLTERTIESLCRGLRITPRELYDIAESGYDRADIIAKRLRELNNEKMYAKAEKMLGITGAYK